MKSLIYIYAIIIIIIGIIGIAINRKNILLILIIMEMILFSICIILIVASNNENDLSPLCISFYILALAGSELAIGLTIVIRFYRIKKKALTSIINII